MTPDDNFKLPPPPKNIFVTQIQEDLHSSYDKLRQHPIVKQNAASLVKNSSNTQQSTLLLQREQELSDTDAQHREAIDRYNAKNKELTRRENALKDKREKFIETIHSSNVLKTFTNSKYFEERKLKFASYIKDEKSRQQNALNKIELVTNDINDKVKEISELEKERDVLRDEHFELVKKNTELQKYKILLEKAVESMPDGYIEIVGDSPADSLILKYNTLKDTQTHLQERLQDLTEQLEKKQIQIAIDSQLHGTQLLEKNKSLSKNQSILETESGQCAMMNQLIAMKEAYAREQKQTLAKSQLAIDNIGSICYQHRHSKKKPAKMTVFDQLDFIQDFILDLEQTVNLAVKLSEESDTTGVEGDSNNTTRTHNTKSKATLSLK